MAGEEWSARTRSALPVPRGTPVRVVAQDGLVLIVEPVTAPATEMSGPAAGASPVSG